MPPTSRTAVGAKTSFPVACVDDVGGEPRVPARRRELLHARRPVDDLPVAGYGEIDPERSLRTEHGLAARPRRGARPLERVPAVEEERPSADLASDGARQACEAGISPCGRSLRLTVVPQQLGMRLELRVRVGEEEKSRLPRRLSLVAPEPEEREREREDEDARTAAATHRRRSSKAAPPARRQCRRTRSLSTQHPRAPDRWVL